MKVMIIEDNVNKKKQFIAHLNKSGLKKDDIIIAKNMSDFAANLNSEIDLFIIDFYIPNNNDASPQPNGLAIIESIIKLGKGDALLLAISSYPDEFPKLREVYESHGCILADFKKTNNWKTTLDHLLMQLKSKLSFDFVIFCALEEERYPYITILEDGQDTIRSGIDCYDIEIENKRGTVVVLPEMGLVNAAIYAGMCIERFKPKVIGISGICGGFKDKVTLGQLLVSSLSYEYQSGKWSEDLFLNAPYQAGTEHLTLTMLKSILKEKDLIRNLESDFNGCRPNISSEPKTVIFTSGSAVIASSDKLNQISRFHSKVSGIDMEIYAIQQAAKISQYNPENICAKVVVDLCDADKNDNLHAYGAFVSANFLIKAISRFFSNN
jgi:nucleoside phosphorylase